MTQPQAAVTAICTECGRRHTGGRNIVLFRLIRGCGKCAGACTVEGYRSVRVDSLRKGAKFVSLGTLLEYQFDRDNNGCCYVYPVDGPAGQEPTIFAGCATALIQHASV